MVPKASTQNANVVKMTIRYPTDSIYVVLLESFHVTIKQIFRGVRIVPTYSNKVDLMLRKTKNETKICRQLYTYVIILDHMRSHLGKKADGDVPWA